MREIQFYVFLFLTENNSRGLIVSKKVNKKQLLFALTAICLVGLIGVGISYAYYVASFNVKNPDNGNNNVLSVSTTNVILDIANKQIAFDGAYPGHIGLREFTIRGEGAENAKPTEASIKIIPNLGVFKDDVTWKLYKSDTAITCTSEKKHTDGQYYEEASCNIPSSATLELSGGASEDYKNITVYPNTETKYYLVVEFANKENQNDQQGQEFTIDIDLAEKHESFTDKIIAQLDTEGNCPTLNDDGTVTVTSGESTNGYLCKAKDAYGDSYYYRGNVTNNYVKFADEYWRIVRINGDGSIRIVYDGTSAHANGEDSDDRQIGESAFNNNFADNAYAGYMYGDRSSIVEPTSQYSIVEFTNTDTYYIAKEYNYDASADSFTLKDPIAVLGRAMTSDYVGYYTMRSSSASTSNSYVYKIFSVTVRPYNVLVGWSYVVNATTSKEAAQTNKYDSTIKTYLDNWYKTNIVGTENEKYLTDNIFCNDRSISSYLPSDFSNKGYGNEYTAYRWFNFADSSYNNKMMLTCLQQNDAFTVNDTSKGNGALTYPVGLLSMDEVVLAGGWKEDNKGYYLYSGEYWWTSSPNRFDFFSVSMRGVDYGGNPVGIYGVSAAFGVRAVLNLKSGIQLLGTGTMDDPYHL